MVSPFVFSTTMRKLVASIQQEGDWPYLYTENNPVYTIIQQCHEATLSHQRGSEGTHTTLEVNWISLCPRRRSTVFAYDDVEDSAQADEPA